MRTLKIWLAVVSVLALNSFAQAETKKAAICTFELDSNSLQVNWTAFKTNQKAAVNGSFSEVTLEGELHEYDLARLLGQLEAEIQITDAEKVRTGNTARDATLFQHFFNLIKHKAQIKGAIQNVKMSSPPDENGAAAGTFDLKLTMNQKTQTAPFQFKLTKEGAFSATSSINVLDFGLSGALADLHKACEALHTGTDGVSKTWPNVDLKLGATIRRSCN